MFFCINCTKEINFLTINAQCTKIVYVVKIIKKGVLSNMKAKSLLQQQAYDFIKEKILSGDFAPDTLYSETKLAAEVGISRTPMREALQCLSQDGYLSIVPSKGFQIRQLTQRDMRESIQVRCAIEGFCTASIADSINTPEGIELIASLEQSLEKMRLYAPNASKDHSCLEAFINYDHEFHLKLVQYVDNSEFEQLYQRLMYMIRLTSTTALSKPGRIEGTLKEHEDFLNTLKEGNAEEAYKILIHHLLMPITIHESN